MALNYSKDNEECNGKDMQLGCNAPILSTELNLAWRTQKREYS